MTFFYFIAFFFGLTLGSFLNCVIYRLETGGNFLKGRSFCPYCKHSLSFWDLIPVLSFFILKRKCRYCQKLISWQYPLVELGTAILFLAIFYYFISLGFFYTFFLFFVACLLILIFVYDLKHYIIPDSLIFSVISIAFFYNIYSFFANNQSFLNPFLAGLGAAIFFLLIVLISGGKWMGVGDVKLAFFIGLFLGYPNILIALFLAFFIGAIIGIGLIILKRKTLKSEVPFGPFLIIGTFLALFWGMPIIDWYFNLFY